MIFYFLGLGSIRIDRALDYYGVMLLKLTNGSCVYLIFLTMTIVTMLVYGSTHANIYSIVDIHIKTFDAYIGPKQLTQKWLGFICFVSVKYYYWQPKANRLTFIDNWFVTKFYRCYEKYDQYFFISKVSWLMLNIDDIFRFTEDLKKMDIRR